MTDPELAVTVALPSPTAVASPEPSIPTIPAGEVLQLAELVKFCVLPSLKLPIALNCCVSPSWIDGFAVVTAMDSNVTDGGGGGGVGGGGDITVSRAELLTEPEVALIVVPPGATATAIPEEAMVAIAG